ncbi:MAG: cache domain-containing protein [Phormidesmis sp.]
MKADPSTPHSVSPEVASSQSASSQSGSSEVTTTAASDAACGSCQWPFKAPGIKASLVGAILVTISATSALVYIPWALISRRNIDTIVTQANEEIVLGTSQEVKRLFNSAKVANQLLQNNYQYDLVDFYNSKEREALFLSVLSANPNFSWVQLGYDNGDFFGAQRLTDGTLKTHFRDWQASDRSTTATVHTYPTQNPQESVSMGNPDTIETVSMDPPFFAPARPWYTNAIAAPNKMNWTVYVYRSTQQPGMDAAITLNDGNERIGVVAIGIELNQLSEFLIELQDSLEGEVFIINKNREILASTDIAGEINTQGETPKLQRLGDSDNPLLQYAQAAIDETGTQMASGERLSYVDPVTGDRYFVSLNAIETSETSEWLVGTIVPAKYYLADIQKNRRRLLFVISAFIATTAGLAVYLSDRVIARPILTVTKAAADIEAENFQLDCLSGLVKRQDELGQLARVFSHMAKEVHVREKRLKRQVKALRIEIDEVKREKQVNEIVESDFFQDLTAKANNLRQRSKRRQSSPK